MNCSNCKNWIFVTAGLGQCDKIQVEYGIKPLPDRIDSKGVRHKCSELLKIRNGISFSTGSKVVIHTPENWYCPNWEDKNETN